jgi:hypothetical protein
VSAAHAEQIIQGYFSRLESEAADLPKARREELRQDVRDHITQARAGLLEETDADILNILDRLGEPADLVQESRDRFGIQRPQPFKPGFVEIGALVLLPVFWIVGVVLLWASNAWNTREKLIGTFLVPGGLWTVPILLAGVSGSTATAHVCTAQLIPIQSPVTSPAVGGTFGPAVAASLMPEPICVDQPAVSLLSLLLVLLTIAFLVLPILTSIYLAIRLRRRQALPAVALAPSG